MSTYWMPSLAGVIHYCRIQRPLSFQTECFKHIDVRETQKMSCQKRNWLRVNESTQGAQWLRDLEREFSDYGTLPLILLRHVLARVVSAKAKSYFWLEYETVGWAKPSAPTERLYGWNVLDSYLVMSKLTEDVKEQLESAINSLRNYGNQLQKSCLEKMEEITKKGEYKDYFVHSDIKNRILWWW